MSKAPRSRTPRAQRTLNSEPLSVEGGAAEFVRVDGVEVTREQLVTVQFAEDAAARFHALHEAGGQDMYRDTAELFDAVTVRMHEMYGLGGVIDDAPTPSVALEIDDETLDRMVREAAGNRYERVSHGGVETVDSETDDILRAADYLAQNLASAVVSAEQLDSAA